MPRSNGTGPPQGRGGGGRMGGPFGLSEMWTQGFACSRATLQPDNLSEVRHHNDKGLTVFERNEVLIAERKRGPG